MLLPEVDFEQFNTVNVVGKPRFDFRDKSITALKNMRAQILKDCNHTGERRSDTQFLVLVGLVWTALALLWIAVAIIAASYCFSWGVV